MSEKGKEGRYLLTTRALLMAVTAALFLLSGPVAAPAQEKPIGKTVLPDGMAVLAQEYTDEIAAACLFVRVGSAYETRDANGITSLLNHILISCHPLGGSSPPALKIEQLGGRLTVETESDFSCFTLVAPARSFGASLKVFAEALSRPDCSDAALRVEKDALLANADRREDRLVDRAYRLFLQKTYGESPYALDAEGDGKSVSRLGQEEMLSWHKEYYRPENMLISICGKFGSQAAVRMVEEAFREIQHGRGAAPRACLLGSVRAVVEKGSYKEAAPEVRAAAVIGYSAPPLDSPDYPAMRLAEALLAEGMGSRIYKALREENDLAYSFGSIMEPRQGPSRLAFYVSGDEKKVDLAVEGIKRSVQSLKEGGFTIEELERAKGLSKGALLMSRETARGRAWFAGMHELLGVGSDFGVKAARQIEKLDKAELVKAAGRYLDNYTLVVLKPKKSTPW